MTLTTSPRTPFTIAAQAAAAPARWTLSGVYIALVVVRFGLDTLSDSVLDGIGNLTPRPAHTRRHTTSQTSAEDRQRVAEEFDQELW